MFYFTFLTFWLQISVYKNGRIRIRQIIDTWIDPDPQQNYYYKEQIVWMLFFYNTYGWLKVVHSRWKRTCSFHRNFTKMLPKEYFIYTKSEDMTKENPYFMEMLTSQLYLLLLPLLIRKLK